MQIWLIVDLLNLIIKLVIVQISILRHLLLGDINFLPLLFFSMSKGAILTELAISLINADLPLAKNLQKVVLYLFGAWNGKLCSRVSYCLFWIIWHNKKKNQCKFNYLFHSSELMGPMSKETKLTLLAGQT